MEVLNRLKDILISGYTGGAELFLGSAHLVWGLWLLTPPFNTFTLPSYSGFLAVAPEWVWGLV